MQTEQVAYKLGKIFLIISIVGVVLLWITDYRIISWFPPCAFFTRTGLYCPGCGGTRAVKYMLTGHFLKSLYYQPAILPATVVFLIFMVTHTIQRIFPQGRIKGIRFRMVYVYVFLGLLVLNIIMKNFFGLVWADKKRLR